MTDDTPASIIRSVEEFAAEQPQDAPETRAKVADKFLDLLRNSGQWRGWVFYDDKSPKQIRGLFQQAPWECFSYICTRVMGQAGGDGRELDACIKEMGIEFSEPTVAQPVV